MTALGYSTVSREMGSGSPRLPVLHHPAVFSPASQPEPRPPALTYPSCRTTRLCADSGLMGKPWAALASSRCWGETRRSCERQEGSWSRGKICCTASWWPSEASRFVAFDGAGRSRVLQSPDCATVGTEGATCEKFARATGSGRVRGAATAEARGGGSSALEDRESMR